jgi:hypothetical protein
MFPETYSYIIFIICELNWVDAMKNIINELRDDDEDYFNSKDTSFTDGDKYYYFGNVDCDFI